MAAAVVIDTVARLLPGAVGNAASVADESFSAGLLEYPQYTRPQEFRGRSVPEVLRSGDHEAIARWRHERALEATAERRPDLLETAPLDADDRATLARRGPPPGGRHG